MIIFDLSLQNSRLKNCILNVNKQLNSPDTRNIFSPADKKNSKKLADGNFVEERYSPFIFFIVKKNSKKFTGHTQILKFSL